MKLLIISTEYFPDNGPGADRISALTRGIMEKGIDVCVLRTIDVGNKCLWKVQRKEEDLIQTKSAKLRYGHRTFLDRLLNIFIPLEPKIVLSFFNFRCVLDKAIKEFEPDIIFSSSNPLTTSLFALYASKRYDIDFIPEFRDPWSSNPLRTWPSYFHYAVERLLEKYIYENSKELVVNTIASRTLLLQGNPSIPENKVHVLSHSFDTQNLNISKSHIASKEILTIGYAGGFYIGGHKSFLQKSLSYRKVNAIDMDSSPITLLKAVEQLNACKKDIEYRIVFVGTKKNQIAHLLNKEIEESISFLKSVPRHEVTDILRSCDCVYITNPPIPNSPFISTKTFDYLAMDKPILAELEKGEQLSVLKKSELCLEVKPRSLRDMKEALINLKKGVSLRKNMDYVSLFERSRQTEEFVKILEQGLGNTLIQNAVLSKGLKEIKNDY